MPEEESFLVPTDVYFKAGVHIGTKFRTKYMQPFIYKIRTDGLAVLNVSQIDKRIRIAAKFLARFAPEDVIVVSRRENGWKPVKLFGKYTGCKVFPGRYQPGILTNPKLARFTEAKIMLVTDAWPDRNAVKDAKTAGLVIQELDKLFISNVTISKVDHSKIDEFKNQIKVNAVKAAKEKAESLVSEIDQSIGRAIYIKEIDNIRIINSLSGKVSGVQVSNISIRGARTNETSIIEPEIEFEKIELQYSIMVRFELN